MSRLPLVPWFALLTSAAVADPALERRFTAEPLWVLQSPEPGAAPVHLWLDPRNPGNVFVGCSQPRCRATLQFGPENVQLQGAAGKTISFEIEDARVPLFFAKQDGSRLMPSWVVPTGREHGGH